jgi:thiamine-monophosphate kinase
VAVGLAIRAGYEMSNADNLDGLTIGDLGEWRLIEAFASQMPTGPDVTIGIGDDAAVVAAPGGKVVAAVDMLLEDRHFKRSWSTAHDVGVKAAARSLADIAAMGAVPTALLVSLAAPASLPASWAVSLAEGLASEASRAGAAVVGGDTSAGDSIALSVTALGSLSGPVVPRSGARAGDVVAVAGRLGWSEAGYALLAAGGSSVWELASGGLVTSGSASGEPASSGAASDEAEVGSRGAAELVAAHLRPSPPYEAGPQAASLGATAMIDTSDGLLADLGHIATASDVVIDVDSAALDVSDPLTAAAHRLGTDPLTWVLTGGEDHALAATFPSEVRLPSDWHVIGRVYTGPPQVRVNGMEYRGPAGWQHFR